MFEIWMSQGQGGTKIGEFISLREDMDFVIPMLQNKDGSFAIKLPSGN